MVTVNDKYADVTSGTHQTIEEKCLGFIDHAEDSPKYMHQRQRAAICEEFEQGKQWTEEQYARWQEVGIEPITINRCLATIKALTGMYLDNLQDITVIPRKGGTETASQVITEVMKHAQDMGGYEQMAFQTFQQGNITTASYMFLDIDKGDTPNGKICFTSSGFFDVIVDPDCEEYDLDDHDNGAKYVIRKIYMDREILDALYDKKFSENASEGRSSMENYISDATIRSQFYTEEEKTYRTCVYECFWKEYIPAVLIKDIKTNESKLVTENVEKVRRKANKSRRLETEKTFSAVLHRSILVNGKLMEDKKHPYGDKINFYPCVRYVPIWRPNYERGILDDLTNINFEENLRRTQVIRLLNLTANSGWKAKEVLNEESKQELMQYGSVAGFVADESKFGGKLEKIQPNQISEGHFGLAQQSSTDIREVSGLNSALQGYDEQNKGEAGVVLNLRKEQGEAANSSIFKNFRISLEILGNKLLQILDATDIYTQKEIRAIVQESHMLDESMMEKAHEMLYSKIRTTLKPPQAPPQPSPEMWAMVQPEDMEAVYDQVKMGIEGAAVYNENYPMMKKQLDVAVQELATQMLLADLTGGEITQYGVKVVLSPKTHTARLRTFEMLMAIQDKYGVIPPDIMLEYSDLPNKNEIIARMRANQQAQAQQAQQQSQQAQEQQILQATG